MILIDELLDNNEKVNKFSLELSVVKIISLKKLHKILPDKWQHKLTFLNYICWFLSFFYQHFIVFFMYMIALILFHYQAMWIVNDRSLMIYADIFFVLFLIIKKLFIIPSGTSVTLCNFLCSSIAKSTWKFIHKNLTKIN